MKFGFYPKLALSAIKKNSRFYTPYIITCVWMVMMYYIVLFLHYSDAISLIGGSGTIRDLLGFGGWVVAIFAAIILLYTNSFLMKRRKKEFGLYNILGMGKKNISRILFWETVIIYLFSLCAGLFCGILFSKLAEICLVNMVSGNVTYSLSISPMSVIMTVIVFTVIFLIELLNAIRQVRFTNAINLLKSENAGEKPPKANWFLGILGVLLLGAAYYISVSIKDPLGAFTWFFAAVIMVIIGSYMLFISGSVLLCRILQKNKKHYYKPNHFISVSSMAYRMKRNGAGLASICILATMVLVMISSTACLYFGAEDSIRTRYPRNFLSNMGVATLDDFSEENFKSYRELVDVNAKSCNIIPKNELAYRTANIQGVIVNDEFNIDVDPNSLGIIDYTSILDVKFVPLEDYNAQTGQNETLKDDEVLLYNSRNKITNETFGIKGYTGEFRVKKNLTSFFETGDTAAASIISTLFVVLPNYEKDLTNVEDLLYFKFYYDFDADAGKDEFSKLINIFEEGTDKTGNYSGGHIDNPPKFESFMFESSYIESADFYITFGGLFFIGIMLSIVFIFAAVLIIYYKQISEGYEDESRFDIMQKVGMTKKEIKRSINSQLLTVFFLPLTMAGVHLCFAFPMIRKLLILFNLTNTALFVGTSVISFLVFALFYVLVYRITSNAYYKIVSK